MTGVECQHPFCFPAPSHIGKPGCFLHFRLLIRLIYAAKEQDKDSTCAKFAQVADNGKTYQYLFYSLEMIIAVGYRVNSEKAIQFRQWATKVLSAFTRQGYVLDKQRLNDHRFS